MRKVFLEDLPHKKNRGKSCIDWVNSPGYNVRFEYDSIVGSLKIIKIENYKITVEYNGNIHTITRKGFVDCGLAKIVGKSIRILSMILELCLVTIEEIL